MISVRNLSISFKDHEVVHDISFDLSAKKITALVGRSGSGKSVTALTIAGLLPKAKISGEVLWTTQQARGDTAKALIYNAHSTLVARPINLLKLNEKELCKIRGKEIGMVFQDPNTSLNPLHKIGKQIAESVTIHHPKISKKNLENRVKELLKMVELESFSKRFDDYPHQLSGGQKQRVMLAIALANNPKILIADEPTTALDMKIQKEILDLILRLKNDFGLCVLFITHNLRAIARIADEVIEIENGKIASSWTTQQVRGDNLGNAHQTCRPALVAGSIQTKTVLETKNLSVTYKKNTIISDINFSLKSRENLGVIGESGSGKSTLALALCNLVKSQGEIKFFGEKTWAKSNFNLRREVQIVFQDPFASLNPRMTVKEIISEGSIIHKQPTPPLFSILKQFHLPANLQSYYPHQLSGGQRQRVAIARALILNPKILILDEPTSALDTSTQNEIIKLLLEIQQSREISYILISHDLNVVEKIADNTLTLKNGQIIYTQSA